jgi:putative aminopeptidase FrvX
MRKRAFFSALCIASLLAFPSQDALAQIRFNQIKQEVIEARLRTCPIKNAARRAAVEDLFREAGCDPGHLSEQKVKGSTQPNVICVLPGTGESAILVGAHFDHVSLGRGVVDNWSGAALLPSLYQSLSGEPRKHTFVFVAFTGEEDGLTGSAFYAKSMTPEEVARTRAMVNLDCLGLAPTAVWASHADKTLLDLLVRIAAALKLPLRGINIERVGSTDSESFTRRKIPHLTIHSVTQDTLGDVNGPFDDFGVVKWKDYYDTYTLVAAYLNYLDLKLD